MRIEELLSEDQELDELSLGKKMGARLTRGVRTASDVAGSTAGGIAGAWSRAKAAYGRGKNAVYPEQGIRLNAAQVQQLQQGVPFDQLNPPAPMAYKQSSTYNPAPTYNTARSNTTSNTGAVAPATVPTEPQMTTSDQLAKSKAEKAAKDQQEREIRNRQIQDTQRLNIAQAKPGFQQTATDKLAIRATANKKISEAKEKKLKKKKAVVEFNS